MLKQINVRKISLILMAIALLFYPLQSQMEAGCATCRQRGCKMAPGPCPIQCMDMGGCGYDASTRTVSLVATVAFAAIMTGIILAIGFSHSAHVSHSE